MLDFAPQLVSVNEEPSQKRLYANRGLLDYLGTTLDEWRRRSAGVDAHPDDLKHLDGYIVSSKSAGSAFEIETRIRKGDGSYRWFLARFNPVRDDKGNIRRWYVANTDIDDRKRAEERLKEENVALREEIDRASMFEEIRWNLARFAKRALAHLQGRANRFYGSHYRRDRNRQGACRPRHPPAVKSCPARICKCELRRNPQ